MEDVAINHLSFPGEVEQQEDQSGRKQRSADVLRHGDQHDACRELDDHTNQRLHPVLGPQTGSVAVGLLHDAKHPGIEEECQQRHHELIQKAVLADPNAADKGLVQAQDTGGTKTQP